MNTKPTPDPDEPRVDDRPAVRIFTTIESIAAAVGEHVGTTDWLRIDQQRIDDFADATDDHQWIHVDAERAAHGPFGTTVAHGYLTLALLPRFTVEAFALQTPGPRLNYGLNKVRFPAPVPVGSRLRGHAKFVNLAQVPSGAQLTIAWTIEIEHSPKPACVAEAVVLLLL